LIRRTGISLPQDHREYERTHLQNRNLIEASIIRMMLIASGLREKVQSMYERQIKLALEHSEEQDRRAAAEAAFEGSEP